MLIASAASDQVSEPALLVDYGGVLTSSVLDGFSAACADLGVDAHRFVAQCFGDDATTPFAQLELGEIDTEEFCRRISPLLTSCADGPVNGRDWMDRVQGITWDIDERMAAAMGDLIDRGITVVLVSNAWGPVDTYAFDQLPKFTDVVISVEVKLRKPDPRIYRLAAERAGRPAAECVFIDDVAGNLDPARALGMRTVLHTSPALTIAELAGIYG